PAGNGRPAGDPRPAAAVVGLAVVPVGLAERGLPARQRVPGPLERVVLTLDGRLVRAVDTHAQHAEVRPVHGKLLGPEVVEDAYVAVDLLAGAFELLLGEGDPGRRRPGGSEHGNRGK